MGNSPFERIDIKGELKRGGASPVKFFPLPRGRGIKGDGDKID